MTFKGIRVKTDVLSELLKRQEHQGNQEQTNQVKRVSPVSWKHVYFYGEYNFRETPDGIDLAKIVDWVEAFNSDLK